MGPVAEHRPVLPSLTLGDFAMDLGIEGLRVLVTAGANGIGLEIARTFVREGARVHVTDIDRAALDGLAASDPDLTHSTGEVSDRADAACFFDEGLQALGGLDVLVNNAGIAGPTGRVEEINPEDWDRCLEICLTGQFNCARLAVPHLKQAITHSLTGTCLRCQISSLRQYRAAV